MKEQSFAHLFRHSAFVRWNPSTQPLKPSKYPLQFAAPNIDETMRPTTHYGLKHDPPAKLWGRPLNVIKVKELDGEYGGMGTVEHYNINALRMQLLNVLKKQQFNHEAADSAAGGSKKGQLAKGLEKRIPVVGRLLRRVDNGYQVSVVGLNAHLSMLEIPKHCQFTMDDLVRKRVFKFYVKEAYFEEPSGTARLSLSFYES
jgi:hypothetical protein